MTEKLQDKVRVETAIEKTRLRSRSENISGSSHSDDNASFFDPLESSFDEDKFLEEKLSNWCSWSNGNGHGHYPHSPGKFLTFFGMTPKIWSTIKCPTNFSIECFLDELVVWGRNAEFRAPNYYFLNTHLGYSLNFTVCLCQVMGAYLRLAEV